MLHNTNTNLIINKIKSNKLFQYLPFHWLKKTITILKRAINGIISGWNMPNLPENLAKMDSNLYVKIFKAMIFIILFTILFFYFNSELVVRSLGILRIIVLGVLIYTKYKKFFTTTTTTATVKIGVLFGLGLVHKEAGVQTEPTTSCENVTSVGSESALPKQVEASYDIADSQTYYNYVNTKTYKLSIDEKAKTLSLVNKSNQAEVLSVDPAIHPEYLDTSYFFSNAF